MKKSFLTALFILITLPFLTQAQTAAKQPVVKISGEITAPLTLDDAGLHQFTQTMVLRKDRDGNDHTYSGVLVSDILKKAGATMGADLKGENLVKYLSVEASDGYQVVFALAELDKGYTDRTIILADQMDGKPLPAGDGPFRIIVQDAKKKPARCIKQVTAMRVGFAK